MIGKILRYIRICNDFTTTEVAAMMGKSVAYISDIENNRKRTSLSILNKFSACYGIEASRILYFEELERIGKSRQEILKEILEYYIEKEKTKNRSL